MKKNLSTLKIMVTGLVLFACVTMKAQFTAVTSGNWSSAATWGGTAPTATVTGQNITIPTGITVNLDADVTFSGLLNILLVNGTLTGTTNAVYMTNGTFAGTGSVTVGKMKFSGLASIAYAGTLNVKHMINTVSNLAFTSMATVMDTLDLESGSLSLNTNGNLTMNSGSTVKVGTGTLTVNSGLFNSGNPYNVMYVGNTKSVGLELNPATVQNIYVNLMDNSKSVTLSSNSTVNGTLNMSTGQIDINGKKLTLKGDVLMASGTKFISNSAASDIEIMGSGTLSSALMFSSTTTIHNLLVNRMSSGMVKLASALNIGGMLSLQEGTLSIESSGNLTMGAGSVIHVEKGNLALNLGTFTATSSYNVEYMGATDATSGVELTGSGLNNLTVNYAGTNKVVLNNSATLAGKLSLMNGKLDMNGKNLILNGTIDQTTSAWIIGNASSELHLNLTSVNQNTLYFDNASVSNQTLGKLKINTAGANAIMLGSKLFINTELSFVTGKLELGNGDLELMSSATITGYDDTKYIVTSESHSGVLIQNVTSGGAYVTYPVGLSTNYSPAYVQQTSAGTTGNFSAKCHSLTGMANLRAVNRIWMVEGAGVTTVNANLKFGWKSTAEINSFDRNNAYVSHFTNSSWDMTAATSASAGVYSTFELSRTGLTSLSPFAVVENGQPVGIKEVAKTEGFELYPNPTKDVLIIKTLNSDDYKYEVIDVTGKTLVNTSNTNSTNKFDVSGLGAGCYFLKITNLTDNKTTTKRFIKQ